MSPDLFPGILITLLSCLADMPQFCGIADDRVGKGLCCLDHLRVSLSFDLV